ncbi:MAG: hypothetical protein Q4P84_05385 [Elusimicrobiales bacterium]|nr:hypothetical protein [Elusimicrobiales bacterium]
MKNTNIEETIRRYSAGELKLEDANARLRAEGAPFHLDPHHNDLTPEEILHTTAGETPAEANGWGLLDTGTGTLDKVEVRDGKLANMDCGEMAAICIIGGKDYKVNGDTLTE